MFLLRLLIIIK